MVWSLEVEFIDELYQLEPPDELGFGRQAHVIVDEQNPYMHRRVGTFVHHQGSWWLRNDSKRGELLITTMSGKRTALPPGESEPLADPEGAVRFEAGVSNYELGFRQSDAATLPEPSPPDASATGTRDFGIVKLNDEQRLLLLVLGEARLRDPNSDRRDLPSNTEAAVRLGWSIKKFDRKLDYLCRRLADRGVPGLRGEQGADAVDRRANLVEHVMRVGMIGTADLPKIDEFGLD